ncbi:MAG: hypothetical protein H6Q00_908 [Holophagaceae bacterium]|nr:hypothetical protein [Holophagaceae bacterium]
MREQAKPRTQSVVHARVGHEAYAALESWADRQGCSLTQALRTLLAELRLREFEDESGTQLDALARSLVAVQEQQARLATRIEALVAILRSVENGQAEREAQILQAQAGILGLSQLVYAHLLGIVETSPRASEIAASAKAKMQALRGEA